MSSRLRLAGVIVVCGLLAACTGVEIFTTLQKSGVDVTIITNSLAANNQKTVHGGYVPSRKPLLEAGEKIYEVRPDAGVSGS